MILNRDREPAAEKAANWKLLGKVVSNNVTSR